MTQKLLIACLLFAGAVSGQKCSVEIGPELKIDRDLEFWGHLHSDATGHYVLLTEGPRGMFSYNNFTPTLQKYDRAFKLVFSKKIKVDDDNIRFDNMMYAGQKFLLCTEQNDKKADKITYSAAIIGLDGKAEQAQKIAVVQYADKDHEPNSTIWKMSEDTTKMLFAAVADHDDDNVKTKVSLAVFNSRLGNIWSKSYTLPYSQERLTIRSWTVTNDGQVYMLGKVYDDNNNQESKKKNGKRKPAYKMIIFRFDAAEEKPKEQALGLQDRFVTDVTFKLAPNNDLYCAGFYSNDRKGVVQGVFFTRLNGKTGAADVATRREFSGLEIAGFDTEKDKSGDEGLDSNFDFNELVLRDDGGIIVTAEQQYVTSSSYMSGIQMNTTTYYNNNEIFVTSIAPDGAIEWIRMIPKKQTFANTNYFNGYMLMVSGNNLYFLYNEDEDNIGKPLTAKAKRISSFKDAVAGLVSISSEGKMDRRKIFDSREDADALMVPGDGSQISPNELFFVTTKFRLFGNKKIRMGVVRVD